MVDFGKTDYVHAMDQPKNERLDFSIKDFGSSARIGDVLQSLKGEISTGTSHVELVFLGTGKGGLSQGNTNPEMFDKRKREEIRQLSKLNGVSVSTHASVQKAGWSGFNPQANAFSSRDQTESLIELKRTVDFAADAASGGAVVVHTSEFPRIVGDKRFKISDEKEEVVHLANADTGEVVRFSKSQELHLPKWKKNNEGYYVDINGKAIKDPDNFLSRVPEVTAWDEEIKFEPVTYKKIKKDVEKWNIENPKNKRNADLVFFKMMQRENWEKSYAMGQSYRNAYSRTMEVLDDYKKNLKEWQHYEKNSSKDNLDSMRSQFEQERRGRTGQREILKKGQNPSDYWK